MSIREGRFQLIRRANKAATEREGLVGRYPGITKQAEDESMDDQKTQSCTYHNLMSYAIQTCIVFKPVAVGKMAVLTFQFRVAASER